MKARFGVFFLSFLTQVPKNHSYDLHLPINFGVYLSIWQFLYFMVIHKDSCQMRFCKNLYILLSDQIFKCIALPNFYRPLHCLMCSQSTASKQAEEEHKYNLPRRVWKQAESGQCLRHTTLHGTMHWGLWKTPHLPAETFKLLTVFKTRNGISSFWLASFFFSLGKEPSPDAEGWSLGIGKLGLSETFTFKLVHKIGLTQEWGDLLILGKKNVLLEEQWSPRHAVGGCCPHAWVKVW